MKPDKIYFSLAFLIILSTFSWISSCTHQPDPDSLPTICYKEVKTIIGSRCYIKPTGNSQGCHYQQGESYDFSTDIGIQDAVLAGNPDASPMYKAITTTRGESKMPPDQPIPQESRTQIRIWIEQGAKTDACPGDLAVINKGNK
jgi:hypothetical protein